MPVRRPEDMAQTLAEAFNRQDIESLLALYEDEAVLIPEPGKPARGKAALRAALEGFLALKGTIDIKPTSTTVCGDLALTHSEWAIAGAGPDGGRVEVTGRSTEVMRRQPDGTWLYAIDIPNDV